MSTDRHSSARSVSDAHSLYGSAFDAFASLHRPELRTNAVIAFEDAYQGSFDSLDEAVDHYLEQSGVSNALRALRADFGIRDDQLSWNKGAVVASLNVVSEFVHLDDKLHVFKR